jgi:dTDP-4-amino-4,6-dideoxygalactose transaminase
MDGLQGAILSVKLKHLAEWNESRRKNAKIYNDLLAGLDGVVTPREADYAKHVYHIYAVRTKNRDALMNALAEKDIHCGIHYPVPVHQQEAYHSLGLAKGSFPIAELCASELVSLPMFPELTEHQIKQVADKIKEFLSS